MPTIEHVSREIIAAGVGCAIVDGFFNPLEVLKVRLQAQSPLFSVSTGSPSSRAFAIIKSEGVINLWSAGLFPTILRSIFYVGFRIGLYPAVKRLLSKDAAGKEPFHVKLFAGALCGGLGSTIFTPLDLVGLRFKANRLAYTSTGAAFSTIVRADGVRGLWRGCSANVLRATLLSGTQLSVYDQTKSLLKQEQGGTAWAEGPAMHMIASLLSGSVAQLVVMPVDALKTALMLQQQAPASPPELQALEARSSLLGAARWLYGTSGGMRGFYAGLLPALLRQGPRMLVQMPLIEQLRRLLDLDYL